MDRICPEGKFLNIKTKRCNKIKNKKKSTSKSKSISKELISVLSWNLCWGCMDASKNSKNDTTAKQLAEKCYHLKEKGWSEYSMFAKSPKEIKYFNPCLNNVAKSIDKNYDFIGLQEATNWKLIYDQLAVPYLSYVHNALVSEIDKSQSELVTLYNNKKYKLLWAKCGNISTASDRRPYQILVFKIVKTRSIIIIMNLHNKQNCTAPFLERSLSRDLDNMIKVSAKELNLENAQDMPVSAIDYKLFENVKVIALGDFNDNQDQNFWKGIKPFKYSGIPSIENIVVSSQGISPPKTCCTPANLNGYYKLREKENNYDIYIGDYILISDDLEYNIPNHIKSDFEISALKNPTSDHLPIETSIII